MMLPRVSGRTFECRDEESDGPVDGLPDQFYWTDWPRHFLTIRADSGVHLCVRIDHKLLHRPRPALGVRKLKGWLHDRCWPLAPQSWKQGVEYFRGPPLQFGPVLVLGNGWSASRCSVPPGSLFAVRPRVAVFPNRVLDEEAASRLIQWLLSDGFRPRMHQEWRPA
jgi:hypothetical protein